MKIYLVGGAVRDEILGKEPKDLDYVVTGSSIEEMLSLGYTQVHSEFPVFLHSETKDEYALARKEVSTGKGYTEFSFNFDNVSIEEDLYRRDLTINAIAKDTETGEYIDPFNGISHLNSKIIKHVSERFVEDPLRVLRVARFASQLEGFELASDTIKLMKKIARSGYLKHLTQEKIWKETAKALISNNPVKYFQILRETLALNELLPELSNLYGVPQSPIYHPEGCCWTHTMLVLEKAALHSSSLEVRFAALVHDLGKGISPKDSLPSHHGHEKTGLPLVKNLCERLKVSNSVKELALAVTEHHLRVHRCMEMNAGKVLETLNSFKYAKNTEFFENSLLACQADNAGKLREEYVQAEYLRYIAKNLRSVNYGKVLEGKNKKNAKDIVLMRKIEVIKESIKSFKEGVLNE